MPGGRPTKVDSFDEVRECKKHGKTPHRLIANGKTKSTNLHEYAWRCLKCKRSRYQKKEG